MADTIDETLKERGKYGPFPVQSGVFVDLLNAMQRQSNQPTYSPSQEHAITMICLKLSRIAAGNADDPDHWHDIAGYATLAEKNL